MYHRRQIGAWTAFGDAGSLAQINNQIAQIQAAGNLLVAQLNDATVFKVLSPITIQTTQGLIQRINQSLAVDVPSLLAKAQTDPHFGDNLVQLLNNLQNILQKQYDDVHELWDSVPAPTKLLLRVVAGLGVLGELVVSFVQETFPGFIPSVTNPLLWYAIGGTLLLALFLRIRG